MPTKQTTWRQEMCDGLKALQAEGGGVVNLFVVRQCDAIHLLGSAISGDHESRKVVRAVNEANTRIWRAPRRKPMLCATCPRPLREGEYAIVVALPDADLTSQALSLAVCKKCGTEPAEIRDKAIVGLRKFWPDLKPFTVSNDAAGHA